MYRSALVALKPGKTNEAVSQWAIHLATQHQIHLQAISIIEDRIVEPHESVPLGAGAFKVQRDKVRLENAWQQAQEAIDAFQTRCQAAGISCSVTLGQGTLPDQIARAVQSADVLVAGHLRKSSPEDDDAAPLHAMLRQCPRPAIVVPQLAEHPETVVISYDDSLQSARVLHDFALAGWWTSANIHVLSIDEDVSAAGDRADRAVAFLKLHHIAAERRVVEARHEIARHILDNLRQLSAGLLVMGAYGKPTWREFVFGSVTREILGRVEIPVLLSH